MCLYLVVINYSITFKDHVFLLVLLLCYMLSVSLHEYVVCLNFVMLSTIQFVKKRPFVGLIFVILSTFLVQQGTSGLTEESYPSRILVV